MRMFGPRVVEPPPHIVERGARTYAYMRRIERALEGAGYDPEMLDYLPTGHIVAALTLGIK